jgi:hypothetical protein
MTKLPSTLVIHKRASGADTKFFQLNGPFEQMQLQKWLRAITDPGAYTQTTQEHEYAFEPLHNMWSDPTDAPSDDSSTTANDNECAWTPHNTDNTTTPETPLPSLESTLDPQTMPTHAANNLIPAHDTLPLNDNAWPTQQPMHHLSTTKALNRLYRDVCDSNDKMFFIKGTPPSHESDQEETTTQSHAQSNPPYSLIEVVWNATNPSQAKAAGIYKVRLWAQHSQDRLTRSLSQSRFYPALQQHHRPFNKYYPVRPDKVKQVLANDDTLTWPIFDAPLAEIRLIGPFDFSQQRIGLRGPKRQAISETHHIDQVYWKQLEHACDTLGIPTHNIWTIPTTPTTPAKPQPHTQQSITSPATRPNHANTNDDE